MDLTINILKGSASGQITPKDADGVETPVESGTVQYASSNEAVFTVAADPDDETKFNITLVGVGEADLTVSADSDPRPDEKQKIISESAHITVEPDEATSLNITFND